MKVLVRLALTVALLAAMFLLAILVVKVVVLAAVICAVGFAALLAFNFFRAFARRLDERRKVVGRPPMFLR
jgi:hypothetical protein